MSYKNGFLNLSGTGLKELISQGESEKLEFKESLQLKDEIGETISAFSNSKGGIILIGVSDKKKIKGIQIGKKTTIDLAEYIKRNTDPAIFPSLKVEKTEKKEIVVVEVKENAEKPVFFKNYAYKRVGNTNQRISSSEIRKLAKESKGKVYWDEQICEETNLKNIDEERVKWFLKEAIRQRGLKLPENLPIEKTLTKLKLAKNKKLTNAVLLLFSKESWFLQSEIKCIRFSGNEPVKPYIDFESIEGSIFNLVEESMNFVMKNIKKAIWVIPGKIQREEKYQYPLKAIREAIVNAVAHRDYETTSKVQIRIFDSRIEVWSPGLLPETIKIEDLKREHRSIPRNPLLFKQLFWVKYVEDVGGGTLDMIRECKEWGIPEPEFKFITGDFVVFFRLPPALEDLEKLGLNERQVRAMDYVIKRGSIRNKEYISLNNVSRKTATIDLTQLTTKGLLLSVGEGKRNIHYILPKYAKNTQKITQNRKRES